MKTSTILVVITGLLAHHSAATCYGSGDSWPSTEEARSFVWDACNKEGGMFTGTFQPQQLKSMCPHSGINNLGLLFSIQNLNPTESFDLADGDCYNEMIKEIFGCGQGGQSDHAGWRFRADPGNC